MAKKHSSTLVMVLAAVSTVGLVGCGSSSSRGGFSNEAGASGSSPTHATGGCIGSGGGSAAGETGGTQGQTGGNQGLAGSEAETGGNGTGGSEICVPKTCLTLAIELSGYDVTSGDPAPEACGLIETCGNYIDCGNCTTPGTACGHGAATGVMVQQANIQGFVPEELPGIPNICGGGCDDITAFIDHNVTIPYTLGCTTSSGGIGPLFACTLSPDDPNSKAPSHTEGSAVTCEIQYSESTLHNQWCCGQ